MTEILTMIDRDRMLFEEDIARFGGQLDSLVKGSSFLVIGGAGSVGQAVVKEIFRRDPRRLLVADISENNLVELVRDIRSTIGYGSGEFQALPLDCGSVEFDAFLASQPPCDYVLNLSALKHVRSEKDPYTLMRMVGVNILNTRKTLAQAAAGKSRKYFAVSTDKSVNPVNMMGASKSIMEMCLMAASREVPVSTARFANVAFSDGSLLYGVNLRIQKRQPISAPRGLRRYFITPQESGQLCLMSCLLGDNRDIFFPKLSDKLRLIDFPSIIVRYLESLGYQPHLCSSEDEARGKAAELIGRRQWPCYFFESDTTGEKDFEEFFSTSDNVLLDRFESIGVIRNGDTCDTAALDAFISGVTALRQRGQWSKQDLVELFQRVLGGFGHKETGKYLDGRM